MELCERIMKPVFNLDLISLISSHLAHSRFGTKIQAENGLELYMLRGYLARFGTNLNYTQTGVAFPLSPFKNSIWICEQ